MREYGGEINCVCLEAQTLTKSDSVSKSFSLHHSHCLATIALILDQLCPTRCPWAACGPVKRFVRPSLGFRCSKSILYTSVSQTGVLLKRLKCSAKVLCFDKILYFSS